MNADRAWGWLPVAAAAATVLVQMSAPAVCADHRSQTDLPAEVSQRLGTADRRRPRWYFAAETDLNGDSVPELLIHVVGWDWCGTGGCTTFVFGQRDGAYRELAVIPLSRPPIRTGRVAPSGWRTLIVRIGGGGIPAGDAVWHFDGTAYTTGELPADRRSVADLSGSVIHIDRFTSWQAGTALP